MTDVQLLQAAYRCVHYAWEDYEDEGIGIELTPNDQRGVSGLAHGPILRSVIAKRLFVAAGNERLDLNLMPHRTGVILVFSKSRHDAVSIPHLVAEYDAWFDAHRNW